MTYPTSERPDMAHLSDDAVLDAIDTNNRELRRFEEQVRFAKSDRSRIAACIIAGARSHATASTMHTLGDQYSEKQVTLQRLLDTVVAFTDGHGWLLTEVSERGLAGRRIDS